MDGGPRTKAGVSRPLLHYRPSGVGGDAAIPIWLDDLAGPVSTCTTQEQTKFALLKQAPEILLVSYGASEASVDIGELECFHGLGLDLRIMAFIEPALAGSAKLTEIVRRRLIYGLHVHPIDRDGLRFEINQVRALNRIARQPARPSGTPEVATQRDKLLIGNDRRFQGAIAALARAGRTSAPVLITGESGTGKELAARVVHNASAVRSGPLVAVNCAGLAPTLVASELFGHEKGAFTDAREQKIGKIEAAQNGTLFLDEIADLPLELQGYLLRFLEDSTIVRVGGNRSLAINARVIAATNVDLRQRVAEGRFRQDLYYRLDILSVALPPLRERGNDARLLAKYFLDQLKGEFDRPRLTLHKSALAAIVHHRWPGNVRELSGVLRRAVVMAESDVIDAAALGLANSAPSGPIIDLASARAKAELDAIKSALERTNRNIIRASKQLGVSRVTLYRLMERHDLVATLRSKGAPSTKSLAPDGVAPTLPTPPGRLH